MLLNNKIKEANKITVVTVNFNVAKNVNKLVKSLLLIDDHIKEILIIDNNSKDSRQIRESNKTKIIFNKSNLGFAKAVNQGIRASKSKFILLINPDCYLPNKSILKTIELLINDSEIGAVGGRIKKSNLKEYQMTANSKASFMTGLFEFTNLKKIFPDNHFSKSFWIERSNVSTMPVESLCGAYTIIRKKIDNKLNLFDERYFLYMEDVDFGNKVNSLGYKVIFDPRSEIIHIGGKSSNSKYNIVLQEWYFSRKEYFKKHLNTFESKILNIIFTIEEKVLKIMNKI